MMVNQAILLRKTTGGALQQAKPKYLVEDWDGYIDTMTLEAGQAVVFSGAPLWEEGDYIIIGASQIIRILNGSPADAPEVTER